MNELKGKLAAMLSRSGIGGEFSVERIPGGANNRVYRVDAGGNTYLLKQYFSNPGDTRDRIGAEYGFLEYAKECAIECVPEPICCDRENLLALYGFIDGRRLEPGEVGEVEVRAALDFVLRLNSKNGSAAAEKLAPGSEACFSVEEHLATVERRVGRLAGMQAETELDRSAKEFAAGELTGKWKTTTVAVMRKCQSEGINLSEKIADADIVASPSDFGYHNALASGGKMYFIDFEYAGIDDPAKLVCDFFCQPAAPVPLKYHDSFAREVASLTIDPPRSRKRFEILLPVYRIKWACIMLNDFLPADGDRRRFADAGDDYEKRKQLQLQKATDYVTGLEC